VLQLVAEGRSSKEVASLLGISVRTAEAHKARLLHVLGLESTAELVHHAIRTGVISVLGRANATAPVRKAHGE
jgi:DNA-binding CsgD family transcriptional regulator